MGRYRVYEPWCYDDHLCLKVPFALVVSILYLSRHLILPLVVFATARKTGTGDLMYLIGEAHAWIFLLASVPAAFLVLAWARRTPAAGAMVRRIWRSGRWLLVTSALLDLGLRLWLTSDFLRGFTIAAVLLDGYIMIYLFMSPRARDVFRDFPAASSPVTTKEPP
ncbi:MAG TPA: DUF2919 family protein [Methylococcus sp.]|nr:DUF2919 family protein [Methylococcus sp.]